MRLCTWNVLSGGGKRIEGIAEALNHSKADIGVLTEYRPAAKLEALLRDTVSAVSPPIAPAHNGVLVFGRVRLSPVRSVRTPRYRHRWLTVATEPSLLLLGVHVPNKGEKWNKEEFWERILAFGKRNVGRNCVIMGDLNTGLDLDCEGTDMSHQHSMEALISLGWVDAWRAVHGNKREYSWYSPNARNGYRLDHCFVSTPLANKVRDCWYNPLVREHKLSDHSMLLVDLEL